MNTSNINLSDLGRLSQQLKADSTVPLRELQDRDHALNLKTNSLSDVALLKSWLAQISPITNHRQQQHSHIEWSISLWLILLGLISGTVVMTGLLLVGEQQVINVLLFLSLFIGTQLVVLLLTLFVGIGATHGLFLHLPFENFNPARLLFRRAIQKLAGNIRWESFSEVGRLALLRWGQIFGVSFNSGAIIAFLIVLAATDKTFGWSSTFNINDQALYETAGIIAAPWSWLLHNATVSIDIIATSRMNALQTDFGLEQIELMRSWWPFLLACIFCYGLLPRLLLLLIFQVLYRRRLTHAFVHYSGAGLVLNRLRSPQIQTQNFSHPPEPTDDNPIHQATIPAGSSLLVSWAAAANSSTKQLLSLGFTPSLFREAGLQLDSDQQLVDEIKESEAKTIIVAVKSWEPPLAELGDFLSAFDKGMEKYLLLLSLDNKDISEPECLDWQQFAANARAQLILGGSSQEQDD